MSKSDSQIVANYSTAFVESFKDVEKCQSALVELTKLDKAILCLGSGGRDLLNDKIPAKFKLEPVKKIMKILAASEFVSRFVSQLLSNNRLKFVSKIVLEIQKRLDVKSGISDIKIFVACELSDAERGAINKQVVDYVGGLDESKARFSYEVDSKLLGGVVVQVDSRVLDMSVKARLKKMQNALMN